MFNSNFSKTFLLYFYLKSASVNSNSNQPHTSSVCLASFVPLSCVSYRHHLSLVR